MEKFSVPFPVNHADLQSQTDVSVMCQWFLDAVSSDCSDGGWAVRNESEGAEFLMVGSLPLSFYCSLHSKLSLS